MVDFIKQHWLYILGALALHAVFAGIFGLTMLNMQRTPPPVQLAIQAVVVDPAALNKAARQQRQERERERVQQREREAEAQREREQAEQQRREQEEEATRKQQEETARRESEQRAEQERQVELKQREEAEQRRLAEEQQLRERQEAEKKRAAAEAERKKRAEEEAKKVAEIERRQKEEAERRRAADEARLQEARESELARQLAEEEADAAAASSPEMAQYVAMIRQQVERRWKRPLSARDDLQCQVQVRQTPAGVVLSVRVGTCNGDAAVKQSIEVAVQSASPLPLPSNPRLFNPNLTFVFRPGGA
ncbi:MAG TPA: cell envelope integrity protein TolA [Steroidobacter sp.]|uniref:cell envelope integrity protein TolA n=1 Tax=Steroidobacter sp. TaxID=1978227 RepID=UPI002EDB446C